MLHPSLSLPFIQSCIPSIFNCWITNISFHLKLLSFSHITN